MTSFHEVHPTVPIEYDELKKAVRDGLPNSSSRCAWWPVLVTISSNKTIDSIPDLIGAANRLHTIMKEPLLNNELCPQYENYANELDYIAATMSQLKRIINKTKLFNPCDETTFNRWEPLLRLLISTLRRVDLCYLVVTDVVANKEKYIDYSSGGMRSNFTLFKEMLNSFMPKTFKALSSIGALDDKYLELIFVGMFTELLPPKIVLRLVGSYLMEGKKILFRYGLALIRGYKSLIKGGKYGTAGDLWFGIKADAAACINKDLKESNAVNLLHKQIGIDDKLPSTISFDIFYKAKNRNFFSSDTIVEYAFDLDRSGFEKFRRPMNVSTQCLRRGSTTPNDNQESKKIVESSNSEESLKDRVPSLTRSGSVTERALHGSNKAAEVKRRSSTSRRSNGDRSLSIDSPSGSIDTPSRRRFSLSIDDEDYPTSLGSPALPQSSGISSCPETPMSITEINIKRSISDDKAHTADTARAIELFSGKSSIISDLDSARKLISFIPLDPYDITTTLGMQLVYSTDQHGYSLSSLYTQIAGHQNVVILIKLAGKFQNVVLGGYIATEVLVNSGSRVKKCGNALTRCFRLDSPNEVLYTSAIGDRVGAVSPRDPLPGSNAADIDTGNDEILQNKVPSEIFPDTGNVTDKMKSLDLSKMVDEGAQLAALEQYVVATNSYLSLGCSLHHGTAALHIDEDIRLLTTGITDTFNNPPLVVGPEEHKEDDRLAKSYTFPIEIVEAFAAPTPRRRGSTKYRMN